MTRGMRFVWVLAFVLAAACTPRAQAPVNVFYLDASADEAFSRVVSQLGAQGFDMASFEKGERRLRTEWREVPGGELANFAKLKERAGRYEKGRFAYEARISEADNQARVEIKATVEGLYTPRQNEGQQYGTVQNWTEQPSNGVLERNLFNSL